MTASGIVASATIAKMTEASNKAPSAVLDLRD